MTCLPTVELLPSHEIARRYRTCPDGGLGPPRKVARHGRNRWGVDVVPPTGWRRLVRQRRSASCWARQKVG